MATKKLTIDDFTQQPQAKTAQDVNGQDARTRLWQSLDYAYGDQRRKSDQQYAQAVAQADRQALGRGMQRSSYNAQTLANLRQKGIEANNDITSAQIADYQNRLGQIEQQEKEDERWERQFAEQQRQYNEGMDLNREQFAEQKANTAWNQNFQQTQADQSQANWQSQFNAGREDAAQAQQNWQTSFDASRQDAAQSQQNWQTQFDATQAQQKWQNEFAQNQFAYQQEQDAQPELRQAAADVGGQGDGRIGRGAALDGADDAEDDAQRHADHKGQQGQIDRDRDALADDVDDPAVVGLGHAQIARERALEPQNVAYQHRLVHVHFMEKAVVGLAGDLAARHGRDGIARQEGHQQVGKKGYDQQHEQRLAQPLKNVSDHPGTPLFYLSACKA